MTAAYDDDTISSRRQENVKNSDKPVDISAKKSSAIITLEKSNLEDKSGSCCTEVKGNGAMSENHESADLGENPEESVAQNSLESKTVNSSITGRCVDVENVVVNKDDVNCTSSDRGNSLETCLMPRKQKNFTEEEKGDGEDGDDEGKEEKEEAKEKIIINSDTQEAFSCIDIKNSIVGDEISRFNITDKTIIPKENSITDKNTLYTELITNCSELKLSSTNTSKNNIRDENKDLNYNLTDENKSQGILINHETLQPVNHNMICSNPTEEIGVVAKLIRENEFYSGESFNNKSDNQLRVMNYKSKTDIFGADKTANFESISRDEDSSSEDYDPECEISFHEAIRSGDAKSVEMLMERGIVQNIDEPDWNVSGDPPLLVAATNHSLPVLRALLTNGCDPGVRSPRGETALHRAIMNGSPSSVFEIVEELLNHDCPATVKEAGGGLTALHILTRQLAHAQSSKSLHHNFDIALKTLALLAKVGPVDAKDHQGRSALHLLASSSTFGNSHKIEIEPMIRTLLEAGADPALKNDRGETPLHEALECGALNTAFLLIPHTPVGITSRYGETPLHIAARKNQPEVVESLLKRGEDPSFQDAGGNTPLHLASARGFHHTVSLLVTSPLAQLEKTNDDGLTSLQVAAESGFVNAVRLLLKAGADPSQSAHYCVTTLHRHPDISVLIDHELTRRRQLAA